MQRSWNSTPMGLFSTLPTRMRILFAFSLVVPLVLNLAGHPANAIPLSDLVNGGSITQGDKVFSNFSGGLDLQFGTFSPSGIGGIDVQGITSDGIGGVLNQGLQFSGPFSTSGSGLSVLSFFIQYDVSVQDSLLQINGLSTSLINPAITGDGEILLSTEAFNNGVLLGVGDVTDTSPQSNLAFATQGLTTLRVDQTLVLFSEGGTVSLEGFGTTFSQSGDPGVIPEPATLLLVGSGLLGLALRQAVSRQL